MLDQSIYKYKAAEKESFQTWKERKCELCSSLTGNPVKLPKRHARKKLSWEQVVSKYAGTSQEKHAQPKQESRKSGYMNMQT